VRSGRFLSRCQRFLDLFANSRRWTSFLLKQAKPVPESDDLALSFRVHDRIPNASMIEQIQNNTSSARNRSWNSRGVHDQRHRACESNPESGAGRARADTIKKNKKEKKKN
jgi:hypothetical protein